MSAELLNAPNLLHKPFGNRLCLEVVCLGSVFTMTFCGFAPLSFLHVNAADRLESATHCFIVQPLYKIEHATLHSIVQEMKSGIVKF